MSDRYRLVRKHSLPEDEGRDQCVGLFGTVDEAAARRDEIEAESGGYFRAAEFRIEPEAKE